MSRKQRKMTRSVKKDMGMERTPSSVKKPSLENHWNLDWFTPEGDQQLIINSMEDNNLTLIQAPSGTGKSTTVLWKALNDYRLGKCRKIYLIKNPTEAGDDQLGFLSGDKTSKLDAHVDVMKKIFWQFMTKEKFQNDLSAGNLVIDIPNYMLGATLDDCWLIIEEGQTMSPNTIKLVTERAGQNTKVVILGDPKQSYSIKRRPDGLKDIVERCTEDFEGYLVSKYNKVGYIRMSTDNNMRSDLSQFITELYEDE